MRDDVRDYVLSVRLTPDERGLLDDLAEALECSRADAARTLIRAIPKLESHILIVSGKKQPDPLPAEATMSLADLENLAKGILRYIEHEKASRKASLKTMRTYLQS